MAKAWDLIVIGAGSSGAALAGRCAERGRRVLLIEAGPDYRSREMPEVWRSPNTVRAVFFDPEGHGVLLWQGLVATRTDVQEARAFFRGRGTGGSSAINGQIAIRPLAEDFNDWAGAGCAGWSWQDVLPYFCRLEADYDFGDEPYHGSSGPIPVYRMPRAEWGSVDEALARAGLAYGFPWAEDVNAPGASGVSPYPINSRDRRRVSTNDGYLEPNRGAGNLTILGGTPVDRVLFEGHRAVGVEIVQDGRGRVERSDEVVVCAGAIHSPGILIRSGIGPERQLAELGIDVVADLPVGEGLQDHPMLLVYLLLRPEATIKTPDDRHTNCCVRFSSGDKDGAPGDLMLTSTNQMPLPFGVEDGDAGVLGAWLNWSYSRGAVTVASRDSLAHPVIRERMLSDERDLRRMRHAVRLLADIAADDAVLGICSASPQETNRALWNALDDDRELDRHLLATVTDAMHATSTCRMGPADDPTTVVDSNCRVLGIDCLRVADASIFPTCPRANTNLAAIAVGEVLADRL